MGLFKVIKNHPKKTLLAVTAISYAYNYVSLKYSDDILRRHFCNLVKLKGLETVPPTAKLRRLTVFLNPFARQGSLLKEFEKNVAPLLQLSGLDVQMVYTDNDFQAKDYVRVIDPQSTDGILVASDDHVLQKVVTALLERPELTSGPRPMPVGIVPIGVWNAFASTMAQRQNLPSWCFNLVTPLLDGSVRMQNVLEISTIPYTEQDEVASMPSHIDRHEGVNDPKLSPRQTAFSLSGLEWSIWRDVEHGGGIGAPKNKSKPTDPNNHRGLLPILSPLSFRSWTRRFGATWRYTWFWLKSIPEANCTLLLTRDANASTDSKLSFFRVNAEFPSEKSGEPSNHRRVRSKYGRLVYTPACDGCSSCWSERVRHLQPSSTISMTPTTQRSASLFSQVFGLNQARLNSNSAISKVNSAKRLPEDRSLLHNPECGRAHSVELRDTASLVVTADGNNLQVEITPTPKNFLSYMRQAFVWLRTDSYHKDPDNQDSYASNSASLLRCSTLRLYPQVTQNEFYWIDNDHFEACPVEIRVRVNAIDVYATPLNSS